MEKCQHNLSRAFGYRENGKMIYEVWICSRCDHEEKREPTKKTKGYYEGIPITKV